MGTRLPGKPPWGKTIGVASCVLSGKQCFISELNSLVRISYKTKLLSAPPRGDRDCLRMKKASVEKEFD